MSSVLFAKTKFDRLALSAPEIRLALPSWCYRLSRLAAKRGRVIGQGT